MRDRVQCSDGENADPKRGTVPQQGNANISSAYSAQMYQTLQAKCQRIQASEVVCDRPECGIQLQH